MKITFHADKEHTIKYYINLSIDINSRSFSQNKLLILPYEDDLIWYFPDIGLFDGVKYKEILNELLVKQEESKNYFYAHDEKIYEFVSKNMPTALFLEEEEIANELSYFEKVCKHVHYFCEYLFKENLDNLEIVVIPAKFGTGRTYATDYSFENKVVIYAVYKFGNANAMIESIFSGIMNYISNNDRVNWNEMDGNRWKSRELILDFFIKYTNLSSFGVSLPTSIDIINIGDSLKVRESIDYYNRLGVAFGKKMKFEGVNLFYDRNRIKFLSKQEIGLLKLFIEKSSEVVTYDDIAMIIWKDEWRVKFSLEAIAKAISRLRVKLSGNNLPKNLILTVRGIGYMLVD